MSTSSICKRRQTEPNPGLPSCWSYGRVLKFRSYKCVQMLASGILKLPSNSKERGDDVKYMLDSRYSCVLRERNSIWLYWILSQKVKAILHSRV